MRIRRPWAWLAASGFVLFIAVVLLRTTGIHCDESNYLSIAVVHASGDAADLSKPVLFYWVNFVLYHLIGRWLGALRPLSFYFFYAALFTLSLVFATEPLGRGRAQARTRAMAFACLLISPLVMLNATQLMMEALVLPPIACVIALSLRETRTRSADRALVACAAVAVAAKVTAVLALLPLGLICFHRTRRTALLIFGGILAGYLFHKFSLRFILHARGAYDFGGPVSLLSVSHLFSRLHATATYFYAWLWFGGAVMVLASGFAFAGRVKTDREVIWLAGASLAGVFAIQFVQRIPPNAEMVRYTYPAIFVGLVPSVLYLARRAPRSLAVILLANVAASSALVTRGSHRFDLWPSLYTYETLESGGSAFVGFPIHGLLLWQGLRSSQPCIELSANGVSDRWERQFLGFVFPGAVLGGEGSCKKPDLYLSANTLSAQEFENACAPACPASMGAVAWGGCAAQKIGFFSSYFGLVRRRLCLAVDQ